MDRAKNLTHLDLHGRWPKYCLDRMFSLNEWDRHFQSPTTSFVCSSHNIDATSPAPHDNTTLIHCHGYFFSFFKSCYMISHCHVAFNINVSHGDVMSSRHLIIKLLTIMFNHKHSNIQTKQVEIYSYSDGWFEALATLKLQQQWLHVQTGICDRGAIFIRLMCKNLHCSMHSDK